MTAAAYAPHGGLVTIGYGNNLVRDYSYNSRLQTSSLLDAVNNNPANILFEMSLNWGANGNLNSSTTSHGGPGYPAFLTFHDYYFYDGLNRLTAGNGKDANNNLLWAQNFGYDAYGNSWVASMGGLPSYNTTPGSNIFTAKNQMNNVSYDAAGNQTSVNGAAVSYDAENRQTQVNEPLSAGGAQVSFGYDGLSQRVSKTNGSAITVYVYDAPGRMVAQYSSVAPGTAPCRTCFLSVDQLGSTRLVTDIGASVIGRHDYVPFGQEIPGGWAGRNSDWGANDSVNQKFTGQERDADTNIDYFKARYYGSLQERFTSPDPYAGSMDISNPQSFNRYAYVLGNPLGNTDPSGMDPFSGDPGDGGWDGDPCLFDPFLCGGGISFPSWPAPAPSQPGTTTVPNPGAGAPPQSTGGGYSGNSFLPAGAAALPCILDPVCLAGAVAVGLGAYVIWEISPPGPVRVPPGFHYSGPRFIIRQPPITLMGKKADIRQNRGAAQQVAREAGCRPPNPDDYDHVHEIIKDQKGPDGKVSYEVLLDAWREVLCQ